MRFFFIAKLSLNRVCPLTTQRDMVNGSKNPSPVMTFQSVLSASFWGGNERDCNAECTCLCGFQSALRAAIYYIAEARLNTCTTCQLEPSLKEHVFKTFIFLSWGTEETSHCFLPSVCLPLSCASPTSFFPFMCVFSSCH